MPITFSKAAEKAIAQFQTSIHNGIWKIRNASKRTCFEDLAWLLFAVHVIQIKRAHPRMHLPQQITAETVSLNLLEEGIKYAVQTAYKYGKPTQRNQRQSIT